MSTYRYILFDMDGTLIDSKPGIIASIHHTEKQMGLGEKDDGALQTFLGPPLYDSFIRCYGMDEKTAQEAMRIFREYYADAGAKQCDLYEGMTEVLAELQKNHALFIATSKPAAITKRIAAALQIDGFFLHIEGSSIDRKKCSKSDIVKTILDSYSISPADAIMIGDRDLDVIGAANCGVSTLGVTYGYGTGEELESAGACGIVAAPWEIVSFIDG